MLCMALQETESRVLVMCNSKGLAPSEETSMPGVIHLPHRLPS